MALEYIERPPRIQPELPVGKVNLPNPPERTKVAGQSLLDMLIPLITIIGFVFVSGSGNVAFILPIGLAMVISVGAALYNARKGQLEQAKKEKAYRELLIEKRQEMTRSHNVQRRFYHYNYPDVPTLLEIAARRETSRFGPRLWERRPTDHDFGALRLGLGSRPSTVVYELGSSNNPLEESPLWKDARQLAADSRVLTDVPITIPLRPRAVIEKDPNAPAANSNGAEPPPDLHGPVRHSLGIFGNNPTQVADFARAMLAGFAAFHSPQDARLYVIGHPHAQAGWQWAEWLPHCTVRGIGDDDEIGKPKQFDQLCFAPEADKVSAFWKRLKRELDQRQLRLRETKDGEEKQAGDVTLPFLLVVVDLLGEMPANSPLKDVAAEAVVATINQSGPQLGAAIIFLANEAGRVPSDCQALVEVAAVGEKVVFRYTEVGLNTPRYLGQADLLTAVDARQNFAARIRRLELLRPFGADLPRSVDLLQMQSLIEGRKIDTVDKLRFQENWAQSILPQRSEWLSVPIGLVSSRDVRHLVFSAKEGGDGVHGMIAGTTGSGKSELLLTLVAGLALKYDPRIVNFVLVDYKGGAAFEPFRKLPHVVDILTNLQANAVERMFTAIQAVMEQRSALLARSGMKDLVEYRAKAPYLRDESLPKTFPHLFIIVDEFAEMITANPDYRAKFESITRLGRAFGVSLILATQRPAGVVSDQMRANMKFRICLRVETPDDSKELLGQPDAAFLPNIGGRGYIQVGNDVLTALQVARVGGDYNDERTEVLRDVIWLDEEALPDQNKAADAPLYSATEVAEALGLKPGEKPGTLVDWIVGIAALRAKRDGVPPQTKPWPDPLPEHLSLTDPVDARYLNTERALGPDKTIIINETIDAWLNNQQDANLWPAFDWKAPIPLRVDIGLVDNPYKAEQRLLTLDLSRDPTVLFGAAGRGKTTFLKTLLTALATTRSPAELHMYALDFGRGGLKSVTALPHLGASIDASEVARVEQLLRMLRNFINERQERLSKYASLAEHNVKNPNNVLPEIVVVIDNFGEFKENYEHLLPELMALIRDGRAFGLSFVITANTPADLGNKLYNLFTQRLTLTQADPATYSEIVGSGAPNFDNVPGRGLIALPVQDKPVPLEFQIGVPGRPDAHSPDVEIDVFQVIAQRMERAWLAQGGKRPSAELPRSLTLLDMFSLIDGRPISRIGELEIAARWKRSLEPQNQEWLRAPIGLISSKEVRTLVFQAQADGVHGMVAGTTGSGKSELIQTLISALAIKYDPRIVNFVLIDYKGGPTVEPFRQLPHCVDIATNLQGNAVERIFIAINAEMNRRSEILAKAGVADLVEYRKKVIPTLKPGSPFPDTFPHLFIIVDEFAEMVAQNPEYKAKFESITRLGRSFGVSLILATQRPAGAVTDQMRANMKFRICLRVETPEDSKELLKKPDAARLPQIGGRGYVQAGTDLLTEVQAAWSGAPYDANLPDPVFSTDDILRALDKVGDPPRSLLGWLVGALALEAQRQGIPKQFKPWPDPLPERLPLNAPINAEYIKEGVPPDTKSIVLSPEVAAWLANTEEKPLWEPWHWQAPLPLRASIGLIDNPFQAAQQLLTIDVAADPIVVFGASGRGKSTFVKSLLLALAAQRSPHELHMYALDFGRGGLRAIKPLPHCGATIDASQPERVAQLFRMIRSLMNERQERLARYASLEDYNAQHRDNPELLFPAVVVVIDNFAEFKENYEHLLPDLMALVRDGRAFGIYYIITAGQINDLGAKLYNLMTQRLTFTLSDESQYADIVGRGALSLANLPGRGLIAVDGQPLEFQVAIPIVEGEKDPTMRLAERMERVWFAQGGKRPAAEIPRSVTLLEMYQILLGKRVERLGDLDIGANWERSLKPENQEWLTAPIGLVSSKEVRTMIFSAKAGGDGVHGMVAGTTGSGKSELIQTLISALAIKYDPRIVNFVLIDYKGGPTVEPFRQLPHCVDIATNLQGNAVERIFIAINAEMNRRSEILAKAGVADLVEYRKKVIPTLKPGSPFPDTFPHLFIIVDEFAEMVAQNPEYKAKFESITRLGRSFGVSLILATQRPAGAVTDQMRANMKFRLCLRVETADDSKEMLGRPDAASLPAIGGRGYIQVGGGGLTEFQAAWSGAPYDETRPDPVYPVEAMLEAADRQSDPPRSLLGWLVSAMALEAKRRNIPKQFKPWPDPLPERLPLNTPVNAEYINKGRDGKTIILNPAVAAWLANEEARPLWQPFDWRGPLPLEARIGLVDNTFLAEQRVLTVDVSADPLLVMGASGRGKSTFLLTMVTALAAQRSPVELHIYALDFGRGGLKVLRNLPHVGGVVEGNEEERVERLFRMVRSFIEERQQKLQAYDSLTEYNKQNPQAAFPAVLVVIDNLAEFRETYDKYLPELIALVRDGRAFGIYFIATATLINDVPNKLYSLLARRITFAQADPSDYTNIMGRGWVTFNDVPGRGLTMELMDGQPQPMEFHTGLPLLPDGSIAFRELVNRMAKAWQTLEQEDPALRHKRARPVEPLPTAIALADLLPAIGNGPVALSAPLGINDFDREITRVELAAKGPHWLVTGPPVSGKTTTLRALTLSLAHSYPPERVALILIDPSDSARRFFNYGAGGADTLDQLPHVLATVTNDKELEIVVKRLRAEFDEAVIKRLRGNRTVFEEQDNTRRAIVVIIDHYDDIEPLNRGGALSALGEIGKGKNLHFVIGLGSQRGPADEVRKRVESSRYALVLQDAEIVRYMGVRLLNAPTKELPAGRGFMVKAVQAPLVQMALPVVEGRNGQSADDQLAQLIRNIRYHYPTRARWSYFAEDLSALEAAIAGDAVGSASGNGATPPPPGSASISDMMAELQALMAAQADLAKLMPTNIPEPTNFATLVIEDEGEETGATAETVAESQPTAETNQKKS
ncbi:MAG: FtsK/SpoIIIE domain-containing protein [Anaerolineales bacterium]|nr:FtsK/SpoIIIE domain-containing protein [Anaerolineales bacterium]